VRADPGVQFGKPDRFRQVIVGTGLEADDHVHLLVAGRQHDDDGVGLGGAQLATDREAIRPGRQPEVEQHEVEGAERGRVQRPFPAGVRLTSWAWAVRLVRSA
jgi:hypothetical protein